MAEVQYIGTGTRYGFDIYTSVVKVLKLNVRKFWGLIAIFAEVTEKKLVGDFSPPIMNRVKVAKYKCCYT